MLLFVSAALAGVVSEVPLDVESLGVLVCPVDDSCEEAAAWVTRAQGLGDMPIVRLDLLLERDNGGWTGGSDTRAALVTAVTTAEAAAAKNRWSAVRAAILDAKASLASVRGDVNTQTLFTLWFLDGAAAVVLGDDRGHEYSFRQAAAIAQGQEVKIPPYGEATPSGVPILRAWADERRKLLVGGEGTLALSGPPGTRWSIDGVSAGVTASGDEATRVSLLPGNHRIVATRDGSVRSWQGEVPVLAGRTLGVTAVFSPTETAAWLHARIDEAFDSLQGPPELTSLLSDWAQRHDLAALRLLRVDTSVVAAAPSPTVGPADPLRPAAADGERVDHGDGIPSTYAEEVVVLDEDARDHASSTEERLRVMWFDPTLGRFSLDGGPVLARPDTQPTRFRVGLHLGYAGMMAHHHATVDLGGAWRIGRIAGGPLDLEGRLGLARADAPYNLYAGWVDQQLYHASLGVRWAPSWDVAPFVAAGPELYVPVAFGARVSTGAQIRIERRWLAVVEVHGGWLDQGPGWGAGLSVGRMY
ncbi:MAG: hypothetical protein Q8P18_11040 [Pseudomonadota bacterium]|nr:hypothetical protein [Pseudomonadota bacterium]